MTNRRRRDDDSSVTVEAAEKEEYGNHTSLIVMNNRIWTSRWMCTYVTRLVESSYEEHKSCTSCIVESLARLNAIKERY